MSRRDTSKTSRGTAIRWGSGGDALVRLTDGREAWAHGVVPGDVATFRVQTTSNRVFASMEKLETPSDDRVPAACVHVDRCGGCPWMVVDPKVTEAAKREAVRRLAGGSDVAWFPSPNATGYRRRARLAFETRRGVVSLGYHAHRSHRIVDVDSCVILDDVLAASLGAVREALQFAVGSGEARLARGANGAPTLFVVAETAQPSTLYDALRALVEDGRFAGTSVLVGTAGTSAAVFGDAEERTPSGDVEPLLGTRDGFSQANDAIALAMASTVREWAEPSGARVLELYAGHGHLTMGLAATAARLTAVEVAKDAVRALRINLARRGLAATVIEGDAAAAPIDPVDVVVLDPPRTGAESAIPRFLLARPARIVMASCDPRTAGRDVKTLLAAGYQVSRVAAFDMFPGTPHVESVVRLDRR